MASPAAALSPGALALGRAGGRSLISNTHVIIRLLLGLTGLVINAHVFVRLLLGHLSRGDTHRGSPL